MTGIVIAGAGECGVRTAFALRENGYGGPVTLVGDEPHLPYERPPLSKTRPAAAKHIAPAEAYETARIDLRLGTRVAEIDRAGRTVDLKNGECLAYDTLVIATGARPRVFPGLETALTLRSLDDAAAIMDRFAPSARVAIVGGGFIGLELAATARTAGAQVTVVEAADRLMARAVPPRIAAIMETRHRDEGVELKLGIGVEHVREGHVRLAGGASIEADLVIAGVGAVPNTALAEAAGLAVSNGIDVDRRLRTSDPDICAAGDCCAFPWRGRHVRLESWRAAHDHANHLAKAIMGADDAYDAVPWFWSHQYDMTLQVAGLPEPGHTEVTRPAGDGLILFQVAADGTLVSAAGAGPGNAVAKDVRLAEMMIARRARPDPAVLADPHANLKSLLKD
ncbi:MAG: FAD-dependent oxidoreductase [Brucellaceae bacterium]|nr:FAD-dependent oxidoreductase [Brucellaceae bacterium]